MTPLIAKSHRLLLISFSIGLLCSASAQELQLTAQRLLDATQDQVYDARLSASGGVAPLRWEIASGSLPTGLVLDASTGRVGGTPGSLGTQNWTVRVSDSSSPVPQVAEALVTLEVESDDDFTIQTNFLKVATVGRYYRQGLMARNGDEQLTFEVIDGELPDGLSFQRPAWATYVMAGIPTTPGVYDLHIRVRDGGGLVDDKFLTLNVLPEQELRTPNEVLLYLSFDSTRQDMALDLSGRENHAVLQGGGIGPGRVGYAFYLPGIEHSPTRGNLRDIPLEGDFTIAAWVRFAPELERHDVLVEEDIWGNGGHTLNFLDGYFRLSNDGSDIAVASTAIGADTWHHCTITRSGSAVAFYIDGAPAGGGTFADTFTVRNVGSSVYPSTTNGQIDELYVIERALPQEEIAVLMDDRFGYAYGPGYLQWMTGHSGSMPAGYEHVWGYMADPDEDGVVNLIEYALDGDPFNGGSSLAHGASIVSHQGALRLQYAYSRLAATTEPRLVYRPLISTDLQQWAPFPVDGFTETVTPTGGGAETVTWQMNDALGGALFSRVEVTLNAPMERVPTREVTPFLCDDCPISPINAFYLGHSLTSDIPTMTRSIVNGVAPAHFEYLYQEVLGSPLSWHWHETSEATHPHNDELHVDYLLSSLRSGNITHLVITDSVPRGNLWGEEETVEYLARIVERARTGRPDIKTYYYETWAQLGSGLPDDPEAGIDTALHRFVTWRARLEADGPMWERIVANVNEVVPPGPGEYPVQLIPAGRILGLVVDEIEAGNIEGFDSVHDLFGDNIHTNNYGKYIIGMIHASVLTGRDPADWPIDVWGLWSSYWETLPQPSTQVVNQWKDLVREGIHTYYRPLPE